MLVKLPQAHCQRAFAYMPDPPRNPISIERLHRFKHRQQQQIERTLENLGSSVGRDRSCCQSDYRMVQHSQIVNRNRSVRTHLNLRAASRARN